MRRASITLTDDLEALLERHVAAMETPPSLNVLMQAALRSYLERRRSSRPRVIAAASSVAEEPRDYDAGAHTAIELDRETERTLRQVAAREGTTPSALAAVVLRQYARAAGRPSPRGIGAYRSGRSDVSSRAEELLREAARARR